LRTFEKEEKLNFIRQEKEKLKAQTLVFFLHIFAFNSNSTEEPEKMYPGTGTLNRRRLRNNTGK
jgi:hypothetical protein